jgi:PhzF family phenazine biosynthesis protein
MGTRVLQVDAFTAEPFRGNPAGVCIVDADASPSWMQAVAAEMNVSETAFLRRVVDGFRIRYFTPVCEVALCGHATLASAHILSVSMFAASEPPDLAHRPPRVSTGRLAVLLWRCRFSP